MGLWQHAISGPRLPNLNPAPSSPARRDVNGADGPLQVLLFDQLGDCLADNSPAREPPGAQGRVRELVYPILGSESTNKEGSQRQENSHSEARAGFRARGARGRCAFRGAHRSSRGARFRGRRAAGGRPPSGSGNRSLARRWRVQLRGKPPNTNIILLNLSGTPWDVLSKQNL